MSKDTWQIYIDSTGSLVEAIELDANCRSGHIFLYEIVINTCGLTVPVGQMLSSVQDTVTIQVFLLRWLQAGAPVPKVTVCDYGRAILNALCLTFNHCSLADYVEMCVQHLFHQKNTRPANTFIRLDVAHLIFLVSRQKCFRKDMPVVKDFYIRGMALLISCESLEKFQEILQLLLITSSHDYDGNVEGTNQSTPAMNARIKLQSYIASESHEIEKIIPDEESEDGKTKILKMDSTDQEDLTDYNIDGSTGNSTSEWIKHLEDYSQRNKTLKGTFANGYKNIAFYKVLFKLAKEFQLWTGVMISAFNVTNVRASSSAVEGDFNELKNRILWNYERKILLHKFFIIHYRAIAAITLIASSKLLNISLQNNPKRRLPKPKIDDQKKTNATVLPNSFIEKKIELSPNEDDLIFTDIEWVEDDTNLAFDKEIESLSCESMTSHPELHFLENWRNKASKRDEMLDAHIFGTISNKDVSEQCDPISKITSRNNCLDTEISKMKENKTKYFRPYPEIQQINPQNIKKAKKLPDVLLKNGCKFTNYIQMDELSVKVTNTCGFDSIVSILTVSAIDCLEYFQHLQKSTNETCRIILLLAEGGVKAQVYFQRAKILLNFQIWNEISMKKSEETSNKTLDDQTKELSESELSINKFIKVDAFSSVTEMWNYIMETEFSLQISLLCGKMHQRDWDIPYLSLNSNVINQKGFKALETAICLPNSIHDCLSPDNCDQLSHIEKIVLNAHIFIDLDIPGRDEKNPFDTMKCRPMDLPVFISIYNEKFR